MKKILLAGFLLCLMHVNAQICFKAPALFTAGQTAKMVRSADFDKNGITDFITVNDSSPSSTRITVFMNYNSSSYSFASQSTYILGSGSSFSDIDVADFDGDSIKDIVTVDNTNPGKVMFFPGNGTGGIGNGTFGAATSVTVGNYPSSISIADYNGDGKPDVSVCTGSPSGIAVLTNTSTIGSFVFTAVAVSMTAPQAEVSADFNGDHKTDIAVLSGSYSNISVFFNDGTGTFTATPSYTFAIGSNPSFFTVGDFDGIGGLDIAAASNSSSYVSVILNNGSGSFGASTNYNAGTTTIEGINCGDFDLDGKTDIICIGNGTSSGIFVFNGTGTGTFNTANQTVNTSTSANNIPVIKGDYNADGSTDLAYLYSNIVNIAISAKPAISGITSLCVGSNSTILTASGATSYSWSTGGNNDTIHVNNLATTTSYTVTGITGSCSAKATTTITVMALPTILITPSNPSICIGSQVALTALGAANYVWNPGSFSGATYSANPGSTTNYTVTGTDANGCINTTTVTVIANPKPPAFASVNMPVCAGSTLTFTPNVVSGGTYAWSEPDGSTSTVQNLSVTSTVANSGTFSLTITSSFGCTNTTTVSAIVNASPTITVNSGSICLGGSIALIASGGVAYNWTPGGNNTATLTTSPVSSIIYTVTGTDANGCVGTNTSTLTVNPLPVITVTANPVAICIGAGSTITATGALTYTWNPNNLVANPAGFHPLNSTNYTVTGTDPNGCVNTATVLVSVNPNDDLSGTVYDTTTNATINPLIYGGKVYLYPQQNASTAIDTTGLLTNEMSTIVSNTNGSYSFSQIPTGSYYLKAEADTNHYHGSVATYLSTRQNKAYRWDSATPVIHVGCTGNIDGGHDISIIELVPFHGTGIISGTITAAPSFGQRLGSGGHNQIFGSPLKGVDVKLGKSPGGGCSARTTADTTGAYTFTNVDTGRYSIYVDIPNYGMVTILTATISPANPQSLNNNYCVDSTNINTCTSSVGIKQFEGNNAQVSIYPNPNNGIFNLQVTDHENMSVEVYSVIGQKVYAEALQNNLQSLNIATLNDGVYFVRVLKNNQVVYQTKVCKQ